MSFSEKLMRAVWANQRFVIILCLIGAGIFASYTILFVQPPRANRLSALPSNMSRLFLMGSHLPTDEDHRDVQWAKEEIIPDYDMEGDMHYVPDTFIQQEKCPACFGESECYDVRSKNIHIRKPRKQTVATAKGVFYGKFHDKYIAMKRLGSKEEYDRFDQFLCQNASLPPGCDASRASMDPKAYIHKVKAFQPSNLRNAWEIVHTRPDDLPIFACLGKDLITEFVKAITNGTVEKVEDLTQSQRANLYSSLVINPEAIIMRFFNRLSHVNMFHRFPIYEGACGRTVMVQHAGWPLKRALYQPLARRIDYAFQVFMAVDRIVNVTDKWSMYHGALHYSNFFVNKNGQVYIVDNDDIGIIDKEQFPTQEDFFNKTVCNQKCMQEWSIKLFQYGEPDQQDVCRVFPKVAEAAMYASVCRNIVSHLPEHTDGLRKGLFEGVEKMLTPMEVRRTEAHLRECVHETVPGGRRNAINEMFLGIAQYSDANQKSFVDYFEKDDDDDYNYGDKAGHHVGL